MSRSVLIEIPDDKTLAQCGNVFVLKDAPKTSEPAEIISRIKTLRDAYEWCLKNGKHEIVDTYDCVFQSICNAELEIADQDKDIIAFLELRIIATALNEGWEPTYLEGEKRWYTDFRFVTHGEVDNLSPRKARERGFCPLVGHPIYGGVTRSIRDSYSSDQIYGISHKLVFKSPGLADYASTQFSDIWVDYLVNRQYAVPVVSEQGESIIYNKFTRK